MKSKFESGLKLIKKAKQIVVLQGDNPDGDSVSSALALEGLLGQGKKTIHLYCSTDIPRHLRYIDGWDRIENDLPARFDLSIVVDTSASSLLEKVLAVGPKQRHLLSKPMLVIDHHEGALSIAHPDLTVISETKAVSTTEVIYHLAQAAKWEIDEVTGTQLAAGLLSDSLGLMTEATTADSIYMLAELVDKCGVKLAALDSARRESGKKTIEILEYKAELIKRIEFQLDNKLALITIPLKEIKEYSDQYNPSMLAFEELRNTQDVDVMVAIKQYEDRLTGKLRANYSPVASKIAEHFGGGGHQYAAGFKTSEWKLDELKTEIIKLARELLKEKK